MVLSILHPHTCGFARVAAWQIAKEVDDGVRRDVGESPKSFISRQIQERFERYNLIFQGNENLCFPNAQCLNKILGDLRKKFSSWDRRKIDERNEYIDTFSIANWTKLPPNSQLEHNVQECKACLEKNSRQQTLFPIKSRRFFGCGKKKFRFNSERTPNKKCQC